MLKPFKSTGRSEWGVAVSSGVWEVCPRGTGCPCTTGFQKEAKTNHRGSVMAKECCLNGVDFVSEALLENCIKLACANN